MAYFHINSKNLMSQIFFDALIYASAKIAAGVLALSTIYLYTRGLTNEQYGIYALSISSISIFSVILFQWVKISLARFYIVDPATSFSIIKKVTIVNAFILFIALTFLLTFNVLSKFSPFMLFLIGIAIAAFGLFSIFEQIANSSGSSKLFGMLNTFRLFLTFIIGYIFLKNNLSEDYLILGFTISIIIVLVLLKKKVFQANTTSSIKKVITLTELLKYGIPFAAISVSVMVIDFSDRFIISYYLGLEAVAIYAATYDLTQQILGSILSIFYLVFYPRLVNEWENNNILLFEKYSFILRNLFLITGFYLILLFTSFYTEISVLLDSRMREVSMSISPWIAIGIVIGAFKGYVIDVNFSLKKTINTQIIIISFMVVTNILLNLILIPQYKLLGASISTMITFAFGSILSIHYVKSKDTLILLCDVFKLSMIYLIFINFKNITYMNSYTSLSAVTLFVKFLIISVFYISMLYLINAFNIKYFTSIAFNRLLQYKNSKA